jgi:hypothetical protein
MQAPMKDRLSFKRLLMKAEDLRKKAVIEATNFNSALDKIDEDKQTYAISSRDGVRERYRDLTCQLM